MTTSSKFAAPAVRDVAALATAVVLSLVWYASRLGFYSDDWAFIGRYATAADQTISGYFHASYSSQHGMRPMQVWLCAALYRLFGMEPLGYHVVNSVFLVLNPILCYAVARELRLSRIIGLAVALTYGLLPSYSTDRYWYVAFAITLSMTAFLASVYADLKAAGARIGAGLAWKTLGAVALLISALSYEVAMPLLLIVPVLMVWRAWQERGGLSGRRIVYVAVLIAVNLALLAGVAAFKLRTTVRLGAQAGVVAQMKDIVRYALRTDLPEGEYGLNVLSAVRVHFGDYGVKLPLTTAALARRAPAAVLGLTAIFALGAFAYLASVTRGSPWPSLWQWAAAGVAGVVIFGLGYAIFLTNYNVQFTATGIGNRSAIAAALGVAMCIVAGIGILVTPLPAARVRRLVFAAAIAALASSGFLIVNVVAEYWADAYVVEQRVLAGIRQRFPTLPPDSTLLLDGVCPYVGPAIVFEASWDLAGALQALYRDETLKADVVTPRLAVGEDAIVTTIYNHPFRHPYGSGLFVYHAGKGTVQPLPDAATARAYFAQSVDAQSCPRGREGIGVELF